MELHDLQKEKQRRLPRPSACETEKWHQNGGNFEIAKIGGCFSQKHVGWPDPQKNPAEKTPIGKDDSDLLLFWCSVLILFFLVFFTGKDPQSPTNPTPISHPRFQRSRGAKASPKNHECWLPWDSWDTPEMCEKENLEAECWGFLYLEDHPSY